MGGMDPNDIFKMFMGGQGMGGGMPGGGGASFSFGGMPSGGGRGRG